MQWGQGVCLDVQGGQEGPSGGPRRSFGTSRGSHDPWGWFEGFSDDS